MATIVVTGVAGFIGSHTAEQLVAAGHRVVGVDNFRTGRRENLSGLLRHENFSLHQSDVAADGALDTLVAECAPAAIVHLAALVSVQESVANPELNFRLNLQATHLVAEAARRHRVPRVVFASSAAVYGNSGKLPLQESEKGNPISPYGAAKLASENLLLGHAQSYHFTAICLRYFNVYGPRQDPASPYSGVLSIFARGFRRGEAVTVFGDGRQTRDFIAVGDVARANLIAATKADVASGAANICTGQQVSLEKVLDIFAARHPCTPAPRHAPARPNDILHSCGDTAKAKIDLGFAAEVQIESGLAKLIGTVD
ncbi:MAG TPA: NAD-dependent epimerase/dehydratase family protein [Candidatus Acidoferrales bacterium]|nr:NAD-dependent epimerase/dehydratase family protein [Candidatus Acidoferrales bacterium]